MYPRHHTPHSGLRILSAIAITLALTFSVRASASAQSCTAPVVPDVFTPNNDGFNDVLVIDCLIDFPENHFMVYNRWGQLVYEAFNYDNNWNGDQQTDKSPLPASTYFYTLEVTSNNSKHKFSGAITLVR